MQSLHQYLIFSTLLFLINLSSAHSQITTNRKTNPGEANFIYQDIQNFIFAHKMLNNDSDTLTILQTEYLDKGTPGLKMFIGKYDLTCERLVKALRKYPEAYNSLSESLSLLRGQKRAFQGAYAELQRFIPGAEFPPTYFLVGGHRGIGSGSYEGPLITIEKESPGSIEGDLKGTLVHEMVHMQQLRVLGEKYFTIFNEEKTLLALSIREGVAQFFAYLVTEGKTFKAPVRDYVIAHESELWVRFREEMLGRETGEWLWSQPANGEQPRDTGYLIGARIAEAYYENSNDKEKTVHEMLVVTDYPAFLERSGYEKKFSAK